MEAGYAVRSCVTQQVQHTAWLGDMIFIFDGQFF